MRKDRNPEYDVRDAMFKAMCDSCYRANRCMFRTSPEGPEEVCLQLIEGGTYDCESCLRRKADNGKCDFKCCFYTPIPENTPHKVPHC